MHENNTCTFAILASRPPKDPEGVRRRSYPPEGCNGVRGVSFGGKAFERSKGYVKQGALGEVIG
jgi:hypothetical protein